MKKVIRLTESDLMRIVKRVISEQSIGSHGPAVSQIGAGPARNLHSRPTSSDKELFDWVCTTWNEGYFKEADKVKINNWTKKLSGGYSVNIPMICKSKKFYNDSQRKTFQGIQNLDWM